MKEIDPHIQRIISWRESFATLPDTHFFELIRMYLGEVHTPYNKPKLIEELGAFLRREENRKTLVGLLSESDVQLICAVHFIQNATQEKVAQFFTGQHSFASVYERLLNLEERLILYRHGDKQTGKTIISINPMLEDVLAPFISRSVLLAPPVLAELNQSVAGGFSQELIAAFISFLYTTPDVCKADGSFRKRALATLEEIFPGKTELLHCITTAFINLSILKDANRGYEIDEPKLRAFAKLNGISQGAFLTVASQGRFSRSGLIRQARLLLDVLADMGSEGYTRLGLLRSAFLISEKENDIPGIAPIGQTGRFASMLARSRANEENFSAADAISLMDRLIDSAVLLGMLSEKGKDEQGKPVFVQGPIVTERPRQKNQPLPKVLSIDAGFTITVLPGLPLKALVPLMQFMDIKHYDTVASFEISKKSVIRAFDARMDWQQICDTLTEFSLYELPQNLRVSLEDWSNSYSSVALYKGYILQVSKDSGAIEKNPAIAAHIVATLAPGIYLLDADNDMQAMATVYQSGVDFVGKIKSAEKFQESASFPELYFERQSESEENAGQDSKTQNALSSESSRAAHFSSMRSELEKLTLSPEQKEGLLDRIERKIILTPVQLRGDSVHLERIEASGMDFLGKVHIIEHAISSNNMVELEYENPNDPDGDSVVIVGNPLSTEKLDGDALIRIELIPQHEEKLFSIGKARLVKRIRGSILK